MIPAEYLVSYGRSGDFGRFRAEAPHPYRRGVRVVIRTERGLETGELLCATAPGHARFLSRTSQGELIRPVTSEDHHQVRRNEEQSQALFDHARKLASDLKLPLEIVDVEVLFDGKQAVVYHLCRTDVDVRPLVSGVARAFDLRILMENVALPAEVPEEHEEHGCGKPDCGSGGGCSSCGTGGGCTTCGSGAKAPEVAASLARLRNPPEERARFRLL